MRTSCCSSLPAILLAFLGLLLLIPAAIATPSSTEPRPDDFPAALRHRPQQHDEREPVRVLSTIRHRLKQSLQHWFRPALAQELNLKDSITADSQGLLGAQYGDQMVLRFNISSSEDAASLAEAAEILFLDVWESSDYWVDIRITKDVIPSLLGLLPKWLQQAHTPLMTGNQLARAIAETYPSPLEQTNSNGLSHRSYRGFDPTTTVPFRSSTDMFFDDYRSLSVITHWMRLMHSLFSTHVRVISVGKSSEGRDIWALKVGMKPNNTDTPSGPRKTIIVSGGSHSREWISTSTVSYIAYSLITQYGHSSDVTTMIETFDWVLIPTLNPDGYLYSWGSDRLWRKNRQSTTLRFCRGLDLDRTYGFKWDGNRTADNPCSESFAGAKPFEAIESKTFSEWALNEMKSNQVNFIGLLDLHSYSEQILYPYSFSCHEEPSNLEDLAELGQGLAKAIRTDSHENYKVIPACEGNVAISGHVLPKLQGGGGSLLDWFYHELGVKHAFQIKLRDKGSYGFLLPKHYIVPTGQEGLSAVEFFGKSLLALYSVENNNYLSRDRQSQEPLL